MPTRRQLFVNEAGNKLVKSDGYCPVWKDITSSTGKTGKIVGYKDGILSRSYAATAKQGIKLPKYIFEEFNKIKKSAQAYNKEPLLILSRDKRKYPVTHLITEKRHLELLRKERELEGETIEEDNEKNGD